MKRILSVYDVSPFIHAGHVNKRAFLEQLVQKEIPGQSCTWSSQYTSAGGTAFLLKAAMTGTKRGDVVFCCDRNPTIKKDMLSSYKSNRDHPSSIENDKRLAEFVLQNCGATVIAKPGYEADDIITTLVQSVHNEYDEIHVYTSDSDLYFLVDDIVSIKPSSSRAKEVTMQNYSTSFKKGVRMPYNFAVPYKMLYGDTSDCIPPMSKMYHDSFYDIIMRYASMCNLGKRDVLESLVKDKLPDVLPSFNLIYPLEVDDIPVCFSKPNISLMINWADLMHCGEFAGMASKDWDGDVLIAEVQRMGIYEED